MRLRIQRHPKGTQEIDLDISESLTLLDLLCKIKELVDPTLAFRSMCRAGLCGTCGVKCNGKPVLACSTWVSPEEAELDIEPLDGCRVIRDLVVEQEDLYQRLRQAKTWLNALETTKPIGEEVNQRNSKSWECILCGICDYACPVFLNSSSFGGPMVFTRLYKQVFDPRNGNPSETVQNLHLLRPDLCTHCMNCSYVCPKKLMPEGIIREEENKLVEMGLIKKQLYSFDFLSY